MIRPEDTSSPACTTLRECRLAGYLTFRYPEQPPPPAAGTTTDVITYLAFDPMRRGLGVIGFNDALTRIELKDAAIHGVPITYEPPERLADRIPDRVTWTPGGNDRIVASGAPSFDGPNQDWLVLKNREGWIVADWKGQALAPNFKLLARVNYGDVLTQRPARGRADTVWTAQRGHQIEGFRTGKVGGTGMLGNIVVSDGFSRIGFFNVSSQSLQLTDTLDVGQTISALDRSEPEFRIDDRLKVIAIADFHGDASEEVVIGTRRGIAVLSFSNAGIRVVASEQNFVPWTDSDRWDPPTRDPGRPVVVGASQDSLVGDFDGDGRNDWTVHNTDGLHVLSLDSDGRRITRLGGVRYGALAGDWRYQRSNKISAVGRFQGINNRDFFAIKSADRISLVTLASDRNIRTYSSLMVGQALNDDAGTISDWTISTDDHAVLAGDMDGDGISELVLKRRGRHDRSGVAILSMGEDRKMYVRDRKYSGCVDSNEACHNSLWGHWLARSTDYYEMMIKEAGSSKELILIQNTGPRRR